MKKIIPHIIIAILFFASCEKDITVDLPQPESKIVVEGYIESGKNAYVFLSYSKAYFAPFDTSSLINSGVKNAKVIISNGTITDTLLQPSADYGYLYISLNIIGEIGKDYSLKIITEDGKELTAQTHLYTPIPLDSVWFKVQPDQDTLGFVWAHLTDPDTLGNVYRWFAKRMGKDKDFIAPLGSVFEDKFINGQSFDFAYNRGQVPNSIAEDDDNDESGYFKVGDTVVVKFCTVGKESFDFWRTAESQYSNNGNPFAATTDIKSNINGGLGIFEGYSVTYDTIIARK
ncbi:MAG TPA: DUF4249 domain-containing protein [Bacteroidia bacterium]|nr:DUF4249 domain-containing protein [Bacteroidia bacterium]